MCSCQAVLYAYMGIVLTDNMCSEFISVKTLEFSFVHRVDFLCQSPHLHLTVMFVFLF